MLCSGENEFTYDSDDGSCGSSCVTCGESYDGNSWPFYTKVPEINLLA